jgi:hypothetical protein
MAEGNLGLGSISKPHDITDLLEPIAVISLPVIFFQSDDSFLQFQISPRNVSRSAASLERAGVSPPR